jgi:RNA polymerase sigma factor (sigma-70 family)
VEDRPPQEAELVVRAKRGERDAYEEIVRLHQTIAFRVAWVITRSDADAEEAAQDAFVKAHAALPRFRDGAPFRPWLLAIVANEARNRVRSVGRRAALALCVAEGRRAGGAVPLAPPPPRAATHPPPHPPPPPPPPPPLDSERREELLAAIERLPDQAREAIGCRYLLELSEEETAAALDCPRGTVKSRVSRALERLRAELGEEVQA